MNDNTFCVLPWMHLATTATGNLRVCCNSVPGKNNIKKKDGSPYKLYKDNLQEAWNSEVYTTIRQQMLEGKRPEMCIRCFREEDVGIKSARQSSNLKWVQEKKYTLDAPFDIRYVDLRLGNLCNLKCRMCNPYASSMWVKEWNLISPALTELEYHNLKHMDWPENEKTWENLFSIANTVEEIYLTGGEPTIIKQQHRLLDYYIENNIASRIKLKYNTNLTNVPATLIDKWKKFNSVQLNCSIDAIENLDHYIRYPSDWNTVKKNFETVRELGNTKVEIHCTVQMYNILKLNELIDWALPYGHKIYFNILNHPEELNIRVLPEHLKNLAATRLEPYLYLDKVQGIIDYMMSDNWNNKYDRFLEYTNVLDKSRNENLFNIVPEFL